MRTTIDLKPEHRARLLELAARRGEKGVSTVIQEAIDAYLTAETVRERLRGRALQLRGSLSATEAAGLRREVEAFRTTTWALRRFASR